MATAPITTEPSAVIASAVPTARSPSPTSTVVTVASAYWKSPNTADAAPAIGRCRSIANAEELGSANPTDDTRTNSPVSTAHKPRPPTTDTVSSTAPAAACARAQFSRPAGRTGAAASGRVGRR